MTRAAKLDMSATIARAQRGDDTTAIAVNIAPLLAPHKKHGRLSLRVERLPQKARFSKGSRNNDGSWSLATDELEDLLYLLPKGTEREHTLAIRIISLAGGNTLAVLEYPVVLDGGEVAIEAVPATGLAADTQVQALRAQLSEMKAALAARDSELAQVRNSVVATTTPATAERDIDAEVSAARAELQGEFDERLTAVGAQAAADLKKQRDLLTAELNARVAALTATAQQQVAEARETLQREMQASLAQAQETWKAADAARLAAAQTQWHVETEKAIAQARAETASEADRGRAAEMDALRATLRAEAQDSLAKAEAAWQAAEASRLAAAQAQADRAIAQTRAEMASAGSQSHDGEMEALRAALRTEARDALAKAETAWKAAEAERLAAAQAQWHAAADKEIAGARTKSAAEDGKTRVEFETLRTTLQREARETLTTAEQSWKAAEGVRLAAAKAEWQRAGDKALADARAQVANARDDGNEIQALREDMVALQAKLAEREAALLKAQKAHQALLEATQREARETLAKAEEKWKREEAARLASAQERWRTEADKALAAARTATDPAPSSDATALDEWREKVVALETALNEREAALAEAQEIIEHQSAASRQRSHKHSKADDKEHMAELEAEWRATYENALNEARSRYEAAEAALAHVRIKTKDGGRTNQELASTRSALAAREKELADLRAKFVPLDGQEPEGGAATAAVDAPAAKAAPYSQTFIGAVIAAAVVFALLIVFYPSIETMIYGAPHLPPVDAAPPPKVAERLPPPAVDDNKATLQRDAKLRADPTNTARVVASVTRGTEVTILETQDKWARVRFEGPKSLEGWVAQSLLKEPPAP